MSNLALSLERWFLYHLIRLFRIRSATEKVARGFALGLMVNFFPTFGLGMVISAAVARALGGNAVAGLAGGAILAFAWPLLFYLNMRTGSFFQRPSIIIDDPADVTEKTMSILVWGTTFSIGAMINALIVGVGAYSCVLLIYARIRPAALRYFRRHATEHQRKLGLRHRRGSPAARAHEGP